MVILSFEVSSPEGIDLPFDMFNYERSNKKGIKVSPLDADFWSLGSPVDCDWKDAHWRREFDL